MSGLKTNVKLSPGYSAHHSSNHNFSQIYKISLDTNLYQTIHTHKHQTQNFPRISPFSIAPVKQTKIKTKAWTHWYHGPSCQYIKTTFEKVLKKEKERE